MDKFCRTFESVDALLAYNTQRLADGGRPFRPWRTHGHDWVGREFVDWQDVVAKASAAWPEGVATVEAMARELAALNVEPPVSCKRRPRWSSDAGDEVDNDRLRAGQDYWRDLRRESSRAPRTVTLVVKVGAPASYDSETLFWPGATALTSANLLEGAGYRVEILAVSSSVNDYPQHDPGVFHAVRLKHTGTPLDVATLANALSNWLIRTAWYQTRFSEEGYRRPNRGEAGVMDRLASDAERISEAVGADDWIGIEGVFSRQAALAKVREVIEKLNS